jgi:hippurate hydrolase
MAASDVVTIEITGTGGHAAFPHTCVDPVIVGASILLNMQTIVSRGVSPLESAVVTFPIFEAGTAVNVIPSRVKLQGSIRTLNPQVRQNVLKRIAEISRAAEIAFGIDVRTKFEDGYPATVNDADSVTMLREATERIPMAALNDNCDPLLATEDFSYILGQVPGAFAFIGNGDTARLHQPSYDFNDEALLFGASFWVSMAQGKRLSLVTRHNPTLGTLIERSS